MSTEKEAIINEMKVDCESLYREENFTDLKVASIRRLIPVKPDGSDDESRPSIFMGQTQLMTQAGVLPVNCKIEASSFAEAIEAFPEAIHQAVERMIEEARELQRQEASRIVVPGSSGGPGKIHIP